MSRIGKLPIPLPDKVETTIDNQNITVKGPLGELHLTLPADLEVVREGNVLTVVRKNEERTTRSFHGLFRSLLNNMVTGVHEGFTRNMEIVGVGYRGKVQGNVLELALGYSHPVNIDIPKGIEVQIDNNTKVMVKGADKQAVGDLCALIRSKRPPEPYKGKGIRFAGEIIRRKAGKSGKK